MLATKRAVGGHPSVSISEHKRVPATKGQAPYGILVQCKKRYGGRHAIAWPAHSLGGAWGCGRGRRASRAGPTGAEPTSASPSPQSPQAFRRTATQSGNRKWLYDHGVTYSLIYTNDVLGNLSGGIRRGTIDQGKLEAQLYIDLEKLAGLEGLDVLHQCLWNL